MSSVFRSPSLCTLRRNRQVEDLRGRPNAADPALNVRYRSRRGSFSREIAGGASGTRHQAVGVLALCRILFGGFGHHGFHRSNFRRRMAERWEHMTPEERERFRQRMRERCGFGPSTSESKGQ